ncbi:MAG: hypothetical protein V4662_26735 [Verrucomicrobiota bacterium]
MLHHGNIWHRNVPWATGDYWRTDIAASILFSGTIHFARFALKDGPIVQVPMSELRSALEFAPMRQEGKTVGPYNIRPFSSVIEVLQRPTRVSMNFGPFDDLDLNRVTTYHSKTITPLDVRRPRVGLDFYGMADAVLDKIRSGNASFEGIVERLQEFNPTLSVRTKKDGSIGREELAYCLMVNALRALKNSWEDVV